MIKSTFEKIWKNCKENRKVVLLMCVFCCAALILNSTEIAREVALLQGNPVPAQKELQEMETETETETETEMETEPETESPEEKLLRVENEKREWRRVLSLYGEEFRIPMNQNRAENEKKLLKNWQQLPGYEMIDLEFLVKENLMPEGVDPTKILDPNERTFAQLETKVAEVLEGYEGEWSVYVKNLSTEESFVINDSPMKSASVMKLFIMGTVYKAFETGLLERTDEIMSLMNAMISYSDNPSSNKLLYLLGDGSYEKGIEKVDAFIQEYGFSDMTVEYNGFNDPSTNTSDVLYNQVAAKDCGKLLEDIYRRTWVNRSISNEMETMLLNQNTRYKIPAGLPDGVLCGNKTGEMATTENDAAIIFGPECDYILVVLSSDWSNKDQAIFHIRDISSLVYKYLNE